MRYFFLSFLCLCSSVFSLDRELFLRKINSSAPTWMVEQIEEDLRPFTNELGRKALNELFEARGNDLILTRVRIVNQTLSFQYSESSQTHCVTPWIVEGLQKLLGLVELPDADFVFTSADTLYYASPNWPIFAESKNGQNPGILFPDRWALKGYISEKTEVLAGNPYYPWESKIPLLFFRGGDTARDHGENWSKWEEIPRALAVKLSLKYPDLIDARFFKSLHNWNRVEQARREGMITDEFFPLREHPRYKYLLDLDGNCASCPRTAAIFHSNSVVFKEASPSHQWWYKQLVPYVHFIPFSSDLSDLLPQLEWAKKHDEECRQISLRGQVLVHDVLSEETIYQFLYELISAYSRKQKTYYADVLKRHSVYELSPSEARQELETLYEFHSNHPCDINEHLPTLRLFASECQSVAELGVRGIVSSWGLIQGLIDNPQDPRSYLGVDLGYPPEEKFKLIKALTETAGIKFDFWKANDRDIELEPVDLLFIDTMHTYAQLTFELEKFSPKIRKYIIMHDTTLFEYYDEGYQGDWSEYPTFIDRHKRGLWTAVKDFTARHPEWKVYSRFTNNNGLTILKRVSP